MAEGSKDKNLETVLAGLEQGWRELTELLRLQAPGPKKVIEAGKFVLVAPGGEHRGWLEAKEDGSSGLVLLDKKGRYRAWLGLKEDGSAYMSLKDRVGRIFWEVQEPRSPSLEGSDAEMVEPQTSGSPAALERLEKMGEELAEVREVLEQQSRQDETVAPSPAAPFSGTAGEEDDPEVSQRLAQVQRQTRGLKLWSGLLTALMLATWAALGFLWIRPPQQVKVQPPEAITLKDPSGVSRAWLGLKDGGVRLDLLDQQGKVRSTLGLDQEGTPRLQLYDGNEKLRTELALDHQGDPGISIVDQAGLLRVALGRVSPGFQASKDLLERPLDSLVLFNRDGNAVWRAPLRWRR